jgi:hypothetical protein
VAGIATPILSNNGNYRTPERSSRWRSGPFVTTSRYLASVPFDDQLATRVRELVQGDASMSERKMFGGLCFMSNGHMCFGIVGDDFMVRVGPEQWEQSLAMPFTREMDFTGRSMRGMVYVASEGLGEDGDLRRWIDAGLDYTSSLPPKR